MGSATHQQMQDRKQKSEVLYCSYDLIKFRDKAFTSQRAWIKDHDQILLLHSHCSSLFP